MGGIVQNGVRLSVDRASGLPIYLQIKYQVIHDISMGRLVAGQALPSIRQAARQLAVTPTTVRHAYASLEEEGFVVALPGKGVVVTELAPTPQAEAIRRQDSLSDLLRPTVMQALGLGYAPSEIQAAVTRSLAEGDRSATILFIGAEPEFIEHYTPLVAEAVRDLHVEVVAISLDQLEAEGPRTLTPFPLCVVTLVRSFARVRELLQDVRVAVIALALDVSPETIDGLIRIPRDARVALVAERVNLPGFAHLVHQYVATDEPVSEIVLGDSSAGARLLRADVVVHSLRARATVARLAPPDCRRVELHFVPNPTSLVHVRQAIRQRLGWTRISDEANEREMAGVAAR
ncbi:MAG: GntR family transcriptional regulator [Thermomicrobiales bacterium]